MKTATICAQLFLLTALSACTKSSELNNEDEDAYLAPLHDGIKVSLVELDNSLENPANFDHQFDEKVVKISGHVKHVLTYNNSDKPGEDFIAVNFDYPGSADIMANIFRMPKERKRSIKRGDKLSLNCRVAYGKPLSILLLPCIET